jgi:hypothetical protein
MLRISLREQICRLLMQAIAGKERKEVMFRVVRMCV